MARGYKELGGLRSLKDGFDYYVTSIKPLLERGGKPQGVVIKDSNGRYWTGNRFNKFTAKWFKVGSDLIRKHLEQARGQDKNSSLKRTYNVSIRP